MPAAPVKRIQNFASSRVISVVLNQECINPIVQPISCVFITLVRGSIEKMCGTGSVTESKRTVDIMAAEPSQEKLCSVPQRTNIAWWSMARMPAKTSS
mmetsp:Transcript_15108/g.23909  ORF Transcript_15108/g.23909 Transcript_15108/m.23909 type:complete len:98 (+) Transcript_15108:448-741(+)